MCLGKGGRNPQSNVSVRSSTSWAQPAEVLSDGEQMTAELRDIVCQFMQKVSVKMCQRRNLHTARSICHPSNKSGGRIQTKPRPLVSQHDRTTGCKFLKSYMYLRGKRGFLLQWRQMYDVSVDRC